MVIVHGISFEDNQGVNIASPEAVNSKLFIKWERSEEDYQYDRYWTTNSNNRDSYAYGTNILQAVGQFNGNYVISVVFMSVMSSVCPALQDYVQPAVAALDSVSEIIEGPSWISLNCPISFRQLLSKDNHANIFSVLILTTLWT